MAIEVGVEHRAADHVDAVLLLGQPRQQGVMKVAPDDCKEKRTVSSRGKGAFQPMNPMQTASRVSSGQQGIMAAVSG